MERDALSNIDLLAWFDPEERGQCGACGEQACVGLPDSRAAFCLNCGAITIDGERIDLNRRIRV